MAATAYLTRSAAGRTITEAGSLPPIGPADAATAAPPVVATTSTNIQGSTGSPSVTKPSGLAVGDTLVIAIIVYDNAAVTVTGTPAAGWNLRTTATQPTGNVIKIFLYDKLVDSADAVAASFAFTLSAGGLYVDTIAERVTGADPTSPFDTAVAGNGVSASQTIPAITTATAQELVIAVKAGYDAVNGAVTTPPAVYTQRTTVDGVNVAYDQPVASAGAVASQALTTHGSDSYAVAVAAYKAPGGSTPVALTDTGSGADALAIAATAPLAADTGSGADTLAIGATAPLAADTGSGADTLAIGTALADTGTGADALAVGTALADTGTGADALAVGWAITDTGSGTDTLTTAATTALAGDSGTSSETLTIRVTLTDTGTGVDAMSASSSTVPVTLTGDSGTSSETLTIRVTLIDTGAGVDAMSTTAAVTFTDTGTGADADAMSTTAAVTFTDTGTGTDAAATAAGVALTDTGSSSESLTIRVTLTDTGVGVDVLHVRYPAASGTATATGVLAELHAVTGALVAASTASGAFSATHAAAGVLAEASTTSGTLVLVNAATGGLTT